MFKDFEGLEVYEVYFTLKLNGRDNIGQYKSKISQSI